MAISDTTGPKDIRTRSTNADVAEAKSGLPAESLGAVIGAVIGSTATALLKTPRGQSVNVAEGLKAGAKTAGAIMVGQMGLLASEAVVSAMSLVKQAQARADEWLSQNEVRDTISDRDGIANEDEESRLSESLRSHGR